MKNGLFFYAHAGSQNHGCEAIVRSTRIILSDQEVRMFSHNPEQDYDYNLEKICNIIRKDDVVINRYHPVFFSAYLQFRIIKNDARLNEYYVISAMKLADKDEIAFSVGGDNYCYSGWKRFVRYRKVLEKRGVKTVLWGCSVEPSMIDKEMAKDLARYNLITARESITYEALKKINPNTVLAPDPAFTLEKQPGNYPDGLGDRPYIGVNVSPLIQGLEQGSNITMENYRALVTHILETTNRDVALIPHVVWEHNDDRIPLGQLYEEFRHTGRVYLVEDQNCMQLKDIISGCEFFVGARTHATIAAYSTCVPTLVVGYSVKARGIARDLFGSEQDYVLPVQDLRKQDDLVLAFQKLYEKKDAICAHLTQMMPDYIAGIHAAKEAVERL